MDMEYTQRYYTVWRVENLWTNRSHWYRQTNPYSSQFSSDLFVDGTDTYSNVAFILAIVFVAIANILLLNVLIALFK